MRIVLQGEVQSITVSEDDKKDEVKIVVWIDQDELFDLTLLVPSELVSLRQEVKVSIDFE